MRPRPPSVRREGLESSGTRAGCIEQLYGFSDGPSENERLWCRIVRWNRLWTSPFASFRSGSAAHSRADCCQERAQSPYDQIVDVPTSQIQDEIPEVLQSTPQERLSERIVARIVDFPLPEIERQMVKVVKIIPQERVSERVVEQIVDLAVPQICECRPCPPSCTALPKVFC